jgi:hypothetical protein
VSFSFPFFFPLPYIFFRVHFLHTKGPNVSMSPSPAITHIGCQRSSIIRLLLSKWQRRCTLGSIPAMYLNEECLLHVLRAQRHCSHRPGAKCSKPRYLSPEWHVSTSSQRRRLHTRFVYGLDVEKSKLLERVYWRICKSLVSQEQPFIEINHTRMAALRTIPAI